MKHHLALACVYAVTAVILLLDAALAEAICSAAAGLIYALMGRHAHDDGAPSSRSR